MTIHGATYIYQKNRDEAVTLYGINVHKLPIEDETIWHTKNAYGEEIKITFSPYNNANCLNCVRTKEFGKTQKKNYRRQV